ncbi:MAG: glycoside hydrolase family 3 C-terminal domain-containing protein, partial [Clostridia bacterium]|nr:glycoside hydrolase family 3 C-terminal domain-containing protein [Clostridia bacterium]
GETPQDSYTDAVKKSYDNYKDAAIIVFSRIGGEGFDLPRLQKTSYGGDPVNGAAADGHYLRLDENEEALIQSVVDSHKFERVIVLINCATSMELGFIEENDAIDAALWIGSPGSTGANAVGKVLSGAVTPSGHLVDTYVRDFTKDPTWQNFGDNLSDGGNTYLAAGSKLGSYYVEYEEGIYLGYRYYETRSQQDIYRFGEDGGWYNESVVYPFGYGLSYATFDWSIVEEGTTPIGTVLDKDANSTVTVKVKVKNTSENYSGKDVVQVYFSAPYYRNQIEKAHVVLGGMAKTKLLAPGEEEVCTVTLKVQDMASYDYNDANDNGFKGYELDMGKYTLYIGRNAHDCWAVDHPMLLEYSVGEGGLQYPYDSETNNDNHFDYMSEYMSGKTLSRSGFAGTFPQTPTLAEREISDTVRNALKFSYDDANADYMKTFTAARRQQGKKGTAPQLYEMIGKDYDDPKWDEVIDYLTVEDMVLLVGQANFHTISLDKIGKPRTIDPDGPAGYTNFMGDPTVHDTCFYASECVIGATWNTALANDMGVMVGLESLVGYTKGDGRTYSGWYAPAVNIHRSPFSGRNWEYYSEDPFLSGSMGAQVVKGASSKGVYTFVKHFVLNDQETNRDSDGLITWADEQTFREIYLKPFRIIVEEGKTSAVMSSFNRIGTVWAGGSYALLTEVLRNEWGFKGMVISDYNLSNGYMHPDQMIRAGGDINLSQDYKPSFTATKSGMEEDVQLQALRLATKNVLYTVANSNAMNGMGEGVVWKTTMAKWKVMLIFVNIGLVLLAALWGFFAIKKAFRKAAAAETATASEEADAAPETSEKEEE